VGEQIQEGKEPEQKETTPHLLTPVPLTQIKTTSRERKEMLYMKLEVEF
jgi:hypothetical protein